MIIPDKKTKKKNITIKIGYSVVVVMFSFPTLRALPRALRARPPKSAPSGHRAPNLRALWRRYRAPLRALPRPDLQHERWRPEALPRRILLSMFVAKMTSKSTPNRSTIDPKFDPESKIDFILNFGRIWTP